MKQLPEKVSLEFLVADSPWVAQINIASAAPVRHASRAVLIGATLGMDTGLREN
jgi:hypothetical protein